MNYLHIVLAFTVGVIAAVALFNMFSPEKTALGSPDGSTFTSARVGAIVWTPDSNTASTTSILNTSSNDYYIEDGFVMCDNFGTSPNTAAASAVNVKAATTTVSDLGLQGNANFALNFNFSTSTLYSYSATSTEGVITGSSRVWPSGTYLSFLINATSTTGVCTVGVNVFSS